MARVDCEVLSGPRDDIRMYLHSYLPVLQATLPSSTVPTLCCRGWKSSPCPPQPIFCHNREAEDCGEWRRGKDRQNVGGAHVAQTTSCGSVISAASPTSDATSVCALQSAVSPHIQGCASYPWQLDSDWCVLAGI